MLLRKKTQSRKRKERVRRKGKQRKKIPTKKQLAKIKKDLKKLATRVRTSHAAVLRGQRISLKEAVLAGDYLLRGKEQLLGDTKKDLRFQKWIEQDCGLKYQTAYNYMRVAKAVAKKPRLLKLGLTDVYLALSLVTRKGARGERPSGDDASRARNKSHGSDEAPITRRIGAYEVARIHDVYVLEVEPKSNWRAAILDVVTDSENLEAVLQDGGLLIRIKTKNQNSAGGKNE